MSTDIQKYNIGAFVLQVSGIGAFTVISFQLTKAIGTITSCVVNVSDCTKEVDLNASSYPKKLGSIKKLFQTSQKTQNIGKLMDVRLEEYTASGKKIWFLGKLCVVTPTLNTAFGVKAGLQCYCMGKACMLMYQPSSDFIYVPSNTAKDVALLEKAGVFKAGSLQEAIFASSYKTGVKDILSSSGIKATDTVLQMLNKALKRLSEWRKKRGQVLGAQQQTDLTDYFTCNIRLSNQVVGTLKKSAHPYIRGLIQDFFNGFNQAILLQAVISSLQGNQRYLTFIPSSIQSGKDMLDICPSYVEKADKSFTLNPQDMLACNVSSNPQQHLRTPTCIYTRSAKMTAWQESDKRLVYWKQLGSYTLPGAAAPYRLKLLDVPGWVLNTLVEEQTKILNKSGLLNPSIQQLNKKAQQTAADYKATQAVLDQLAKTVFFHSYMMDKTAMINLAISDKTVDMDKYIGKSILFQMPIEAAQLGKQGSRFYGRVQNVSYQFNAAQSPKAKSTMNINCVISGVTSQQSPGASIFQDDGNFFIYKRG